MREYIREHIHRADKNRAGRERDETSRTNTIISTRTCVCACVHTEAQMLQNIRNEMRVIKVMNILFALMMTAVNDLHVCNENI